MDFNDTKEEAKFRSEVRAWLDSVAERKEATEDTFRTRYPDEKAALKVAKDFQAKKADAGYAQITWPKEWGGLGGTPIQQVIYNQEESNYAVPTGFFAIGLGMCIPTLMSYCDEKVLERYVRPALRGEEIWCQLFSEPAAGSDVAGLRTRAEKKGDKWIINGQKIWTSGAHYSDYGILLTRTDPSVPKHKGLTMFWIDMHDPAVEARPIKQISGGANFNEVYFTDLEVDDSQRVGEVGEGWKVALTTLMNERLAVGDAPPPDFDEIFNLTRRIELEDGPAIQDRAIREKLADWYVRTTGLRYTKFRTMTALSKGETPGPEASIGKIVSASKLQDIASLGMDLMDQAGMVWDEETMPMASIFQSAYMSSPGLRIAGGTDEILRNIIAERVLGLPLDVRVDRDVAFKDIPSGTK